LLYRERAAKNVDVRWSTVNGLTADKDTNTNHDITGICIIHLQAEPTSLAHPYTHSDPLPIAMRLKKVNNKVKSPIVNSTLSQSVTDASSAHLCFQGPEPAVCRRRLACRMGSHSITYLSIQANPSLTHIWEEGQTSAYYCRNLPGGEAGNNNNNNKSNVIW